MLERLNENFKLDYKIPVLKSFLVCMLVIVVVRKRDKDEDAVHNLQIVRLC